MTLPRGRHKLSRQEVTATQRDRMLRAMAEAMTEHGYVGTPVAEIIKRAGVSRETFYQQFSSKQDCYIAGLETAIAHLATALAPVVDGAGRPLDRFDRLIGAYLETLRAEPAIARLYLVETYAAGAEAMQRRLALQEQFVDGLAGMFGATSAQARFTVEALVGAVISLVTARFVADDVDGLPKLRAPIVALAETLFG